jgi:hypothetical protein
VGWSLLPGGIVRTGWTCCFAEGTIVPNLSWTDSCLTSLAKDLCPCLSYFFLVVTGGYPSTQNGHPRGTLLSLAATQALKLNTPLVTPLLWEAVQVLKKAMDSQTRPVIPHLEFLPTLQDRLPLTPMLIITDQDSKGRSQPPKIRVFRVTRTAITRHFSFIKYLLMMMRLSPQSSTIPSFHNFTFRL